jgi:hypothetical protein
VCCGTHGPQRTTRPSFDLRRSRGNCPRDYAFGGDQGGLNGKSCSSDARNPAHRGMTVVGHERRIGANTPAAGRPQTADSAGSEWPPIRRAWPAPIATIGPGAQKGNLLGSRKILACPPHRRAAPGARMRVEPVSAKTQPVSDLPTPKFRVLKIHRAETGLETLGLPYEVPDIPRQRPRSWPPTSGNVDTSPSAGNSRGETMMAG